MDLFYQRSSNLGCHPKRLGEINEIELALNIANQAKMTVEELEAVDRRGIMLQDEKGRIDYPREAGKERRTESTNRLL